MVATSSFAAGIARPHTNYEGTIKYPGQSMPITLKVSTDAAKVIVIPGFYRRASSCKPKGFHGTFENTDLINKKRLTIYKDSSFSGTGSVSQQLEGGNPQRIAAIWTVKGRFTSATTASGTLSIQARLRRNGRTQLSCPTITVKWKTTHATSLTTDTGRN